MEISFEIGALPKRFNEGMGTKWRARHAHTVQWRKWVAMATMGKRPPQPFKKAELVLTRHSSAVPDFDGLVHSFKVLVDALVRCGIIIDDSMKVIGRPDYRWEKAPPKKGKVSVTIREVKE